VLELGCGSGALTRHLLAAGFQVIATDASPDMLLLARAALGPGADLRRLTLPEDPLPAADAVVSLGHVISYVTDAAAVDQALVAMAGALQPGGILAIDILDLAFGQIDPGRES
jgi:SAM-dependent methyltransferase